MSNPSFENIDKWLFEYVEGNLSPAQIEKLESFLLNNPQFDADLDAWQMAKVDNTPVAYPGATVRSIPSVPFWLISTLTLSAVFVSGMFIGSFLDNQMEVPTEILSAAQVQNVNLKMPRLELQTNSSPENSSLPELVRTSQVDKSFSTNFSSPPFQGKGFGSKMAVNLNQELAENSTENISTDNLSGGLESSREIEEYRVDVSAAEREVSESVYIIEVETPLNSENGSDLVKNSESNTKDYSSDVTARVMTRGTEKIASNYNRTFSSYMKSTVRKIVRMTDNPVALTNSKDIYYHVPGMQTLNVNAATVGNLLKPRLQTTSRAQWMGQSNQQLMNELSFDTYARSVRGGIGIQMSHGYYGQGAYNVGQVALTYSPKFTVTRNFSIEPAIRFKMGDKRLNAKSLLPGQWIEMDRGNEKVFFTDTPEKAIKDLWYKDVALALSSNTKWFSFGFQMDNIGRHYNNVYNSNAKNSRAGIHYTASLGTDFIAKSKIISFSPYLMYQKVENLSEIWAGSIFRYKKLTMGGGISSRGDYAGSIGWKSKMFMLTYQADMTQSNVFDKRFISHQLTIRILMNNGRYGHTMLKQ